MKKKVIAITAVFMMIGGIGLLSSPAKASTLPDLKVIDIYISGVRIEGRTCYIEANIENGGGTTVTTNFYVDYYQGLFRQRFLGRVLFTKDLDPGEDGWADSDSFVWQRGSHWIGACADGTDLVDEGNEGNNCRFEFYIGF